MKASLLAVLVAVLALPALASANEAPNPALAACKADYQQLGATGFAAKYGAGDAGVRACLAAHGGVTAAPAPTNGPEAACKADYQSLGAATFAGKYGAGDAGFRACIQAHGGTTTTTPQKPTQPKPDPAAAALAPIAGSLCELEVKRLGADAFAAKYGAGEAGKRACVQAKVAAAQAILAQCKNESSKDGFASCLKRALGLTTTDKQPQPSTAAAVELAKAQCLAEAKSLGKDAFVAKYGTKEAFGACVKAALPKARTTLAACKASSGSSRDAFKACVGATLTRRR